MQMHLHVRIRIRRSARALKRVWTSHIASPVKDLAVQIGKLNAIRIDESERADPRRCEIKGGGGAESARANAEDARTLSSGAVRPA